MHHANVILGGREWGLSQIPDSEKGEGPDIRTFTYERMSIADVRALIYEANLRPVERAYRTFIICTDSLLHEAQNALLKLFEEPNEHTLFYIILPREDILLPTLASRLHFLAREHKEEGSPEFDIFLSISSAQRLSLVAQKLSDEDYDWVKSIVSGFASYAHKKRDLELLNYSVQLERYLASNGSSKKMLLEHLALILP